jgi:predicted secreted protein
VPHSLRADPMGARPGAGPHRAGGCRAGTALGRRFALACVLWAASWAAHAQAVGTAVHLDAQARAAVANDEMVLTLAVERDGPQPGPLNEQVIAALNAALAEARSVEGVRGRLGSVWTQPLTTREGRPQGWRVRGEVVLESARMPALAQLGGRLAERMLLAGVQFRLSPERRRAEEKRLVAEAIGAFRARAADVAAAFGHGGFTVDEATVRTGSSGPPPRPVSMARASADAAAAPPPPPLPAEGGESEVVVTVSGKVTLR